MKNYIVQYYLDERNMALVSILVGVVLMVGMYLVWKLTSPNAFKKGLSYAIFGAAIFFTITGSVYSGYCQYKIYQTAKFTQTDRALHAFEMDRIEKVLESSYLAGFISFSLMVVIGITMPIFVPSPVLKGVAVGLIIIGIAGLFVETYSMDKNAEYKQKIARLTF
ncbi:MAG TPA: hypothetical protein VNB90_00960 [Cytophagaceae bacterium]|nr:hypothetical protein [Cytophagaceae bacterium]